MSSGVRWPRTASSPCEVRRWTGWSDAKGTLGSLAEGQGGVLARGSTGVNATMPEVRRPVRDVVRALEAQLETTFLGTARARQLHKAGSHVRLRARLLEVEGEAFVLKTLWECPLELGSKQ